MTPFKDSPAGYTRVPDSFFKRQWRAVTFYFSTTFRSHLIHFSGCLLIMGFCLLVLNTPLMERFENVFLDLLFRQRPPLTMHPAIAHIDIDEDSLKTLGRWPWARSQYAALIRVLREWGAKGIVLGGDFSEPTAALDDEAMSQAIREAGNVYLPVALESPEGRRQAWVRPVPAFGRFAKGTGHVNNFPDPDGTIRRFVPFLSYGGETYPYLGMKVAFDYLGVSLKNAKSLIPTDHQGRALINWAGKWEYSFRHYSFLDIIESDAAIREGRMPRITPNKIKGRICVIGLTAPGLTVIKANPLEEAYPAVGVQTHVMNSILQGQFTQAVDPRWNRIALIGIGLLLSLTFLFSKQAFSLVACLGAGLFWVLFAFWLFADRGLWIHVISPLLLMASLFVFSTVFSVTIGKREQERLLSLATRDGLTGLYVVRHFRTLLNDAVREAQKKHRPLSILLLGVDLYKKINGDHGPMAGDAALRFVAENLRLMTQAGMGRGEGSVVGRYGEEEFIVMFRKCRLTDAAFDRAEKIRKQFEQNVFNFEEMKIPLTVSIGAATLRSGEMVPDMMLNRADEALYRAKTEGRNRVCVEERAERG